LDEIPHSTFKRDKDNLIYTADITLADALSGFTLQIHTLDKRTITVPVNDIVHPNYIHTVAGEGMPLQKSPDMKGNLVIHFNVRYPQYLSNEQKQHLKELFNGAVF